MEGLLQFPNPSDLLYDATIKAVCIENETENNVRSCFGIAWRKDQDPNSGYTFKRQLQTKSWLIDGNIPIVMDPNLPDSPNLANVEQVVDNFPGLFGNWVISENTDDGTDTTVKAYRHLPKDSYTAPIWLHYNNDIRFGAYDNV